MATVCNPSIIDLCSFLILIACTLFAGWAFGSAFEMWLKGERQR